MIARLDVRYPGPDLLDDSRALVPEHGRHRSRVNASRRVQIGVADTARSHADEELPLPRRIELELLDHERSAVLVEDGRLHEAPMLGEAAWTRSGARPDGEPLDCRAWP